MYCEFCWTCMNAQRRNVHVHYKLVWNQIFCSMPRRPLLSGETGKLVLPSRRCACEFSDKLVSFHQPLYGRLRDIHVLDTSSLCVAVKTWMPFAAVTLGKITRVARWLKQERTAMVDISGLNQNRNELVHVWRVLWAVRAHIEHLSLIWQSERELAQLLYNHTRRT